MGEASEGKGGGQVTERIQARVRQIVREAVMGEVDEQCLLEFLRQSAEEDWDAGYDQASDDCHGVMFKKTPNPHLPK